jgi:hypothetical protein
VIFIEIEDEDDLDRPKKSVRPAPRAAVSDDGALRKELDVALKKAKDNSDELQSAEQRLEENYVELHSSENRLKECARELVDTRKELEQANSLLDNSRKDSRLDDCTRELFDTRKDLKEATSLIDNNRNDTQALRMDLQDATSRVGILTKRAQEYTRLALLHNELTSDANPDELNIDSFIIFVKDMASDKQDLFKKVQAASGVSDEVEKQRIVIVRLTAQVEKSASEHKAEIARREGGLKDQVVKMEKVIVEYKKEIGVLGKRLKADTLSFKSKVDGNETASHKLTVERDAYLAQKTELEESVEKTTDALSRSQKARDGHVKGIVAYRVNSSRNCSSQDSFKGKRREKHSNGGYFKAEK